MGANVGELREPLRSRVRALLDESQGRVVLVSGKRTRDEQIALRKANCGTSIADIFSKDPMSCNPPTARPGESKHESGLAVDLGGDLQLADQLAAKHGLVRTVEGENWHYELAGSTAAQSGHEGGGGGSLGFAIGPISGSVPNPLSPLQAVGRFVEVLTRRDTWLRALSFLVGLVAIGAGAGMILADLGAVPELSRLRAAASSSGSVATGANGVE